jgi:hypothetical protein
MGTITNAIESVQSAMNDLETKDLLTDDETEALTVLRVCYETMARTNIVESILDTESNNRPPLYKHTGRDTLEEFVYCLVSGMGDISFRSLLMAMLNNRQEGPKRLTQIKISEAIDIHIASISRYINKKNGMNSDHLERIINYILKTQ